MKSKIIVIGASAGGVRTVGQILSDLPADFPASVFVVIHTPEEGPGTLAQILGRSTRFPVFAAKQGQAIERNRAYVAPPGSHMLLERGRIRLSRGPTENRHRPAIDPLFRSAAESYGDAVVGVILSGYNDDGAMGLREVKRQGGVAVVQDPEDALVPSMPRNALECAKVAITLPAAEIASKLVELVDGGGADMEKREETTGADYGKRRPSAFSCPDCHGVLWEVNEGELTRFVCRIGHSYSAEMMLEGQRDAVERALWAAVRALEEDTELAERMARHSRKAERKHGARRFEMRAEASRENANVIRTVLLGDKSPENVELYTDDTENPAA